MMHKLAMLSGVKTLLDLYVAHTCAIGNTWRHAMRLNAFGKESDYSSLRNRLTTRDHLFVRFRKFGPPSQPEYEFLDERRAKDQRTFRLHVQNMPVADASGGFGDLMRRRPL